MASGNQTAHIVTKLAKNKLTVEDQLKLHGNAMQYVGEHACTKSVAQNYEFNNRLNAMGEVDTHSHSLVVMDGTHEQVTALLHAHAEKAVQLHGMDRTESNDHHDHGIYSGFWFQIVSMQQIQSCSFEP